MPIGPKMSTRIIIPGTIIIVAIILIITAIFAIIEEMGTDDPIIIGTMLIIFIPGLKTISDGITPVSYTHLDVYKRQDFTVEGLKLEYNFRM